MGITTKTFRRKDLPPVEMMPDNPKRLFMSKAEVVAESRARMAKKAKIEEYKRKLEAEEVIVDAVRNEDEKGQEALAPANSGLKSPEPSSKPAIDNPLVKRRSYYKPKTKAV